MHGVGVHTAQAVGIRSALTAGRNNGLMNMLKVIQDDVREQLQGATSKKVGPLL